MNKEEILKKAIEKAVKNGWKSEWFWSEPTQGVCNKRMPIGGKELEQAFIFSHSFAKAFWKDAEVLIGVPIGMEWTSHLQAMVLHPNPLDYIEKFL